MSNNNTATRTTLLKKSSIRYSIPAKIKIALLVIPVISLFLSIAGHAQTKETYDLATFTTPKGWKKETTNAGISFTKINNSNGNYAKIILYKSLPGTGDPDKDFDTEWRELIAQPYKTSGEPETENSSLPNGWKVKNGTAPFLFNNRQTAAILTVMSSNATKMSMVILTNTDVHQKEIESFASSLKLKKVPAAKGNISNGSPADINPVNTGFSFTTSTFDDGWVSAVQNDWVLVSRGNTKVYLLYAVPYNSDNFSGTGVADRDYYWDNYVSKYFTLQSKQYRDEGEFMASLKPKYVEGWGINKQTGEKVFLAMTLGISPNTAHLVIAATTDENTLRQLFPKANDKYSSDLKAMDRYNKFAVAPKDIIGQWQNGNTSTMQWAYVTPSGYEGYAGMTLAATSATFNFSANGSYSSIHNGATGAVGGMNTFQQTFKGNYTVSNWLITATNRYGGKTDKFSASFMAIRGGRILKLNNGAGQEYNLVKVK